MQYLCLKQIAAGGKTYCPGDVIPDGVVLPERSGKLIGSGYISKLDGSIRLSSDRAPELYTKEQVADMVARELAAKLEEAMAEMEKERADQLAELQEYIAELSEMAPDAWEGTVQIPVKNTSNGEQEQISVVFAKPEEIRQAFSVLQMNAEEGAKEVSGVDSENVLILLHASDSRVTIKNAAKKRAYSLSLADAKKEEAAGDGQPAEAAAEGRSDLGSQDGDV